jgi:hypothetical protein
MTRVLIVSGSSSGPREAGVGYVQGEQFAHVQQQVAARKAARESLEIKVTLVASPADRRTAKTIAAEI